MTPSPRARFVLRDPKAKEVLLRAAFDDWKDRPMKRDPSGAWRCSLALPPEGTYTYVFVVDGKPGPDPSNPLRNERPSGPVESLFVVGRGDEALPLHDGPPLAALRPREGREFRTLSLNVHAFQERCERFAKLRRIAEGLALLDVDLAGLNEVVSGSIYSRGYGGRFFDTAEILREHVQAFTARPWYLHQAVFGRWEDGEGLGNALLSRHPFDDRWVGELPTRDFWPAPASKRNVVGARLRLPDGATVMAAVTHPMGFHHADTKPQILAIKDFLRRHGRAEDLCTLVMGDFNVPDTDPVNGPLLRESPPVFQDVMEGLRPGDPAQATGPGRRARIDYVFRVNGSASKAQVKEARRIFDGSPHGKHIFPIVSDHAGVYACLSWTSRP